MGMVATGGLLPDLTLVLDIAPGRRDCAGSARPATGSRTGRSSIASASAPAISRPRGVDADAGAQAPAGCPFYPAPIVLIDASADPGHRVRANPKRG